MNKKINTIQKNKGAAMIIVVLFFMFISLTILVGIITPVVREFAIASDNFDSKQSYFIAESGAEDMAYRMKNNMNIGTIGEERTIFLNDSFFPIPTEVTNISSEQKQITTIGNVDENQRKVDLTLMTSTGVSFNYGVLVGQGGVYLDSGIVEGNIYANGPITASLSGSNAITGTAISANSPDIVTDQSNGTTPPAYNITFGNADSTQDVAQSFKVSTSSPINKMQLYIKKVGSPSNVTLKIMNDVGGHPGTTLIATGTFSSIATTYGWVDISFNPNPLLTVGTTYWLVVDASSGSGTKNYIIGANNNGYDNGVGKIWNKTTSTWNNTTPTGLDYFFKIYLGGLTGKISGVSQWNQLHIGTESGTAQAHTVNSTNSTGNIYCKSGVENNKACIDQPDPTYVAFPVSEANITEWKNEALASPEGIYYGNYTTSYPGGQTLGPRKIEGNLNINSWGLTITGNIWVTGNVVMNGGGLTKLDPIIYGENDAVIVVDGTITVSSGATATGSGEDGSYLMLLSQSNSTSAINIDGDAGAVIAYSPYGTINVTGGSRIKEATGYKLNVTGNSSIHYEEGLINNNFSSGPSGSWGIDSWKEVE